MISTILEISVLKKEKKLIYRRFSDFLTNMILYYDASPLFFQLLFNNDVLY